MAGDILVRLFGPPVIEFGASTQVLHGDVERRLIASLVASGPTGLSTDQLIEELYDEPDPSKAGRARQAVYRFRRKAQVISQEGGRYRVKLEREQVDVWRFSCLVEKGVSSNDRDAVHSALELWSAAPFINNSNSLLLHRERERLRSKRLLGLKMLAATVRGPGDERSLDLVLHGIESEPYQEDVTAEAARALYRVGRQAQALALLRECRHRFLDGLGLDTSAVLNEVEHAILTHDATALGHQTGPETATLPATLLPFEFREAPTRFVGRTKPLNDLVNAAVSSIAGPGRLALVRGPAGIGKTTLAAQALHVLTPHQFDVRAGFGTATGLMAYAPFLAAVPEVGPAFERIIQADDPTLGRLDFAQSFERHLAALTNEQPTLLLLEDMHEADDRSASLLRYLNTIALPPGLVVLVTARTNQDGDNQSWADAETAILRRARKTDKPDARKDEEPDHEPPELVTVVDLEALDEADLLALVQIDHPLSDAMLQIQFARQLLAASGGNALVAAMLSATTSDLTETGLGTAVEVDVGTEIQSRVFRQLEAPARWIMSIAAVVGFEFDLATVVDLSERSENEVIDALDASVRIGICFELPRPDRFRFDHALTQRALVTDLSSARVRRLCARLAIRPDVAESDMIRHVKLAGGELDPEKGNRLLQECATKLRGQGSFREAALALQYIDERHPGRFDILVELTACYTRAGALRQAHLVRERAFELACDADDALMRFRSAMAGLPAGQAAGGDLDRLRMFESIDRSLLEPHRRNQLIQSMAIEARILGDYERANTYLPIDGSSSDPALQAERLLLNSDGANPQPSYEALRQLSQGLPIGRPRSLNRLRELRAALTEQVPDAPGRLFDEVEVEIRADGSPRSIWAIQSLDAALNRIGARHSGAGSERALDTGLHLGVPDAVDGWEVSIFLELWLEERLDEALRQIDAAGDRRLKNLAWHGAICLACAATGRLDRAKEVADHIVDAFKYQHPNHWFPPTAVMLVEASVIANWADAATAAAAVLSPRTGWAVIVGLGVAHVGPVDRLLGLAATVTGQGDAAELLNGAIDQATSAGTPLWAERATQDLQRLRLQ